MREILFRGKRVDNGEWVYGFCEIFNEKLAYIRTPRQIYTDVNMVVLESISEFTGLTDKNGKKIFEGDILSVTVNEVKQADVNDEELRDLIEIGIYTEAEVEKARIATGKKTKTVWTVEHKDHFSQGIGFYLYGKNRRFHLKLSRSTLFNVNAEIIGNIHDNPELLKEGADNAE